MKRSCVLGSNIPGGKGTHRGVRPKSVGFGSVGHSKIIGSCSLAVVNGPGPGRVNKFNGGFRCGGFSLGMFFR